MTAYRLPRTLSLTFAALVCVTALLVVGTSLLAYALFHYQVLFHDGWGQYQRLVELPFGEGFWKTYNGHWLVFPALLARANMALFSANLTNLVAVSVLAQVIAAWLLIRLGTCTLESRLSRWLLGALIVSLMLWMGNQTAMTWAFGLTYTLAVLGGVSACYCLLRCAVAARAASRWAWLAVALFGGLMASLSWGSGAVIWPVLVLMALALRARREVSWTVLFAAIAVILLYLYADYGTIGGSIVLPTDWYGFSLILKMFLGISGSYPAHLISPLAGRKAIAAVLLARVAGAVAILLLVWLIVAWWRRRSEREWLVPLIGVALFALGTGLVIGIARAQIEVSPGQVWINFHPTSAGLIDRYRIFSSMLWAALLCGCVPLMARWRMQVLPSGLLWPACALILLLALLPSQARDFLHTGMQKAKIKGSSLALVTGTNNGEPMKHVAFWHIKQAHELAPYLRRHHLTIFRQPWTHWLGTRLPGADTMKRVVPGGLSRTQREDSHGWSLKGWVGQSHRNALILGVDAHGRIRAMAGLTRRPDSMPAGSSRWQSGWLETLHAIDPRLPVILGWGRGWYGFSPPRYDPHELRYFLVTKDKRIIAGLSR